jgi:hypothetical protein
MRRGSQRCPRPQTAWGVSSSLGTPRQEVIHAPDQSSAASKSGYCHWPSRKRVPSALVFRRTTFRNEHCFQTVCGSMPPSKAPCSNFTHFQQFRRDSIPPSAQPVEPAVATRSDLGFSIIRPNRRNGTCPGGTIHSSPAQGAGLLIRQGIRVLKGHFMQSGSIIPRGYERSLRDPNVELNPGPGISSRAGMNCPVGT